MINSILGGPFLSENIFCVLLLELPANIYGWLDDSNLHVPKESRDEFYVFFQEKACLLDRSEQLLQH